MAKKFENSISDALIGFWENYFGWGRATRAEYWWCALIYGVCVSNVLSLYFPALYIIWFFATLIPNICLGARRLHDTGHSYWNILWAFLPIIGWIILLVFLCQPGDLKANKYGPARLKK